jgi:uracil-DNA glycosylase
MTPSNLTNLLKEISRCTLCTEHLPLGPRPVVRIGPAAKILVIGQAPGTRVHASGIPWDDPSGKNLRRWMGVDDPTFYDENQVAIMPMGFCYPGKGKGGDLPPRPECAPLWHDKLLHHLPQIELTLLIGTYAQAKYLGKQRKSNLTETVRAYREYLPNFLPLVHPSPRNVGWQKNNPWFEKDLIPILQQRCSLLLQ